MKELLPEKCQKWVYPHDRYGGFDKYQCKVSIWKDGFCKVHHPDSMKARREKSDAYLTKKWEKDSLHIARNKIDALKKENEALKVENETLKAELETISKFSPF